MTDASKQQEEQAKQEQPAEEQPAEQEQPQEAASGEAEQQAAGDEPSEFKEEAKQEEGQQKDGEQRGAAAAKETGSSAEPGKKLDNGGDPDKADRIIEEGKIFFLFRPKVGVKAAKSVAQLQRFYLVLQPEGRSRKRLIVIGKKRLPSAAKHERYFGFVAGVGEKIEGLLQELGPRSYQTATRGERHLEGARVAGEGHYALVAKRKTQTFLAWTLELPSEPGPVQQDLRIGKQGSLALSIKNPKRDDARIGLEDKADYGEKQKQFGGYAWISASDPALLDTQNAELLLIGASSDLEGEFGAAFGSHMAEKAHEDAAAAAAQGEGEAGDEEMADALREELKTEQLELETAPAADKQWV